MEFLRTEPGRGREWVRRLGTSGGSRSKVSLSNVASIRLFANLTPPDRAEWVNLGINVIFKSQYLLKRVYCKWLILLIFRMLVVATSLGSFGVYARRKENNLWIFEFSIPMFRVDFGHLYLFLLLQTHFNKTKRTLQPQQHSSITLGEHNHLCQF